MPDPHPAYFFLESTNDLFQLYFIHGKYANFVPYFAEKKSSLICYLKEINFSNQW